MPVQTWACSFHLWTCRNSPRICEAPPALLQRPSFYAGAGSQGPARPRRHCYSLCRLRGSAAHAPLSLIASGPCRQQNVITFLRFFVITFLCEGGASGRRNNAAGASLCTLSSSLLSAIFWHLSSSGLSPCLPGRWARGPPLGWNLFLHSSPWAYSDAGRGKPCVASLLAPPPALSGGSSGGPSCFR